MKKFNNKFNTRLAIVAGLALFAVAFLCLGAISIPAAAGAAALAGGLPVGLGKFRSITPQTKIISVNDNLGNPGIKNNQGTTFEVYDYIKVSTSAAKQTLQFFKDVNTKSFPFTNLQQNQIQTGEALALQYQMFTYIEVLDATGEVTAFGAAASVIPGLSVSQYSININNNRVMKPITLVRANSDFNTEGKTGSNYTFFPDTNLTIPPQIDFFAELTLPPVTIAPGEGKSFYLGLHWTGTGAILNIKQSL